MTIRERRGYRRALAFGVLAALVAASGSAANATEEPEAAPSAVTWSVTPADATEPDGRRIAGHEIDPGGTVTDHLAIRNLGAVDADFAIDIADGFYSEDGRFATLTQDQPSTDAGTWFESDDVVTVAAGETAIVPYEITVPESATPGDHAAGVAASLVMASGPSTIGVAARVGFRTMVRVTGELDPALSIETMNTDYAMHWNPFRPGIVATEYTVTNTGNVALSLNDEFGGSGVDRGTILPTESRTFTAQADAWPTFFVSKPLTVHGVASGDKVLEVAATATATTWAVPWPQLLTLLGAALVVGAFVAGRRRSTARLERVADEAREQGRREALTS